MTFNYGYVLPKLALKKKINESLKDESQYLKM